MGITAVFDTHHYIKKLELAGVSEPQAEAHAEALVTIFEDRIATKDDLIKLETGLEARIDIKMANLKVELIKWMIGLLLAQTAAQTTLMVSLFRLFIH